MNSPDRISRVLLLCVTLAVLTAALYGRAAEFPFFLLDDADYVTDNSHVLSGLSADSIRWAFTAFHSGNWHPVTWLSLMVDSQLFGITPAGFHLVNVALHAVTSALLLFLLFTMTGALWPSAFVAACFALHPLHVESVAWIAERKDVLSALFLVLTLLGYHRYVRQGGRINYLLSLFSFSLGLMAKPMLVTTPLLLLLLDYWPYYRLDIRLPGMAADLVRTPDGRTTATVRLLLEKGPFLLLAAASSMVTLLAQKPAISGLAQVPFSDRIANALWSLLMYLDKTVLPMDLAVIYPLAALPLWKAGLAAVALLVVSALIFRYGARHRYLVTGWLWFLISLLPVLGFVQVGRQAMADRYSYLPSIGLFIMASWGGAELLRRRPALKRIAVGSALVLLLLLSLVTRHQLGYWQTNEGVLTHALQVTKNNHFALYCLGMVYQQQEKPEQAIVEFRKSVAIEPREPMVHFDLGYLLGNQGMTQEAIAHLQEAIALDPGFAQAHFTLGILLGKLGASNDSIGEFYEALRLEPDNPKFLNNLGVTLAQQGKVNDAIKLFTRALQVNPDDEKARKNMNIALRQKNEARGK